MNKAAREPAGRSAGQEVDSGAAKAQFLPHKMGEGTEPHGLTSGSGVRPLHEGTTTTANPRVAQGQGYTGSSGPSGGKHNYWGVGTGRKKIKRKLSS